MKCRKAQYNLGHSVLYGGKAMFSEVNSLIFLLIFLVYFLICVAVCRRKTGLYDCRDAGMELVKGLVLILMAIVIKYVCCLNIQKCKKTTVTVLLLLWMALVGAAGLQLMWNMESEEEDDDALEIQEPEDSTMLNGEITGAVQYRL